MITNEGKAVSAEEFVGVVFERAIREQASDVHFEHTRTGMRIRFRLDGALHERWLVPLAEMEAVINNIKVLANLDITTKEIPQDGHFELYEVPGKKAENSPEEEHKTLYSEISEKVKGVLSHKQNEVPQKEPARVSQGESKPRRILDVRVSVYPSLDGETLVARILNRLDALMPLPDLGMAEDSLALTEDIISRDFGMVLITGPVGSGKTTTLYSMLQKLKSADKNIMTIEDPVEFHLDWLRQSELRPERGFTFEKAMRSILRQDPDIIMIGEIRDAEAAEHAISVSLIGRIVGSTVHSNSTVGTIARLVDMGIERSMIAYAINGIISQRLVRRVCGACPEQYVPDESLAKYFGITTSGSQFVRGKGCKECLGTGYKGRIGIFEIMKFDSKTRSMIVEGASMDSLEQYAKQSGMKTLTQDVLAKISKNITTLEEASKVI